MEDVLAKAESKGVILGRQLHRRERTVGFTSLPPPPQTTASIIHYRGDAPLVTIAPTGAGKSSGPVICNALDHPGQFIALDVKGGIHRLTADHRSRMGQEVHTLDFRDGATSTGSLNPLDIARRCGTDLGALARSFAGEMVQRSSNDRDPFWTNWAETMVAAGISFLMHNQPPAEQTLSKLLDLYAACDAEYLIAVALDNQTVTSCTKIAWASYLALPERETRPCVLGSTIEHLRLFDSDLVRKLTDTSSIDLDAFVAGKPMSIYIILPPYRLAAYRPLVRLWLTNLMHLLATRTEVPEHRTLMMVDEAGQLGRMESILTASTLMREFGLTLWTIWQNAAQLEIYGADARTIIDNAGVIQCFGLRNRRMAVEIAALVGDISAEELMAMGPREQVLMIEGHQAQVVSQMRYYEEPRFEGRYPAPLGR